MEIDFISRGQLILAGMSFYGDPFKDAGDWSAGNEIGRLCKRFMDYRAKNLDTRMPKTVRDDIYEVHIYSEETESRGFFEVFVGQEIGEIHAPPVELSIKILPPGQYAKINLVGATIISDWYIDLDSELKQRGWQRGLPFFFQVYDDRYKGLEHIAESELTAYIPVIPAEI